jgi:CheY-like chemotaxis protein/HPt (histidine-containing phosphotransfer) domain-containing protein
MTVDGVVVLDGNCVRRASLLRAVAVAAGRASPEVTESSAQEPRPVLVAPTHAVARAQHRLVLIAEDDLVNQQVILRQMEILGHVAEIAENGDEALRMWRDGDYALLLTDLHMPDMDGYTLAEAIRREEAGRGIAGEARMPILALTANALRGEAIRAQAAGMDEYLTKPLQLQQLKAALDQWLPSIDRPETTPDDLDAVSASPAIDFGVLRSIVGDDAAAGESLLAEFMASARRAAGEMHSARTAGDHRRVGVLAHRLKASARAVGALPLGDLCADLENACRTGTRQAIAEATKTFDSGLADVEAQITRHASNS